VKVVIDIECNSLVKPTHIWCIVCKDIDTGRVYVYRNLTEQDDAKRDFLAFTRDVTLFVGHNFLGYDYPVMQDLLGLVVDDVASNCIDTLVISKLVDYPRQGHSISHYGQEFGLEKIEFNDFKQWSQELENYCVRDVEICHRIYLKYIRCINDPIWRPSIVTEQSFQLVVNHLHDNGFSFNTKKAQSLLNHVQVELAKLDKEILHEFPPRLKIIREISPKTTKFGTLSKTDFRWVEGGDISDFNGGPFCRCGWSEFNPSSHKQIVEVLNSAGWKPVDKTQTHIDTERDIFRLKRDRKQDNSLDISNLSDKLKILEVSGWKVNETNLATLPDSAPSSARSLAKRILYESRRRTLTEWLGLADPTTGRIHGKFYGIGAWTHRMAHQQPNTANIPNEFELDGKTKKLLGKELRSLWQAPRNRLLVGVDAEGIQLRVFAHYINDEEFTNALVRGRKDDKSDPHSLNQRILGEVCKGRQTAKRFVYALLLGAGIHKLAQILETTQRTAEEALDRLLERYTGFAKLKEEGIPLDAKQGWFTGLDGRRVRIPGDTVGERRHLCMSGYLQNGEAVIMKMACLKWHDQLKNFNSKLVGFIHDEWQTETPNNLETAIRVAEMQSQSFAVVGEELGLRCPLAGSYWNDDHKDYTIGTNWSVTH